MKRKLQKAVSVLLVFSMLCCVLAFTPIGAGAAETDETVAASTVKTRDEAVAWLRAQEGARYDIDGAYGSQCSDFTSAYVNYVLTGNPYVVLSEVSLREDEYAEGAAVKFGTYLFHADSDETDLKQLIGKKINAKGLIVTQRTEIGKDPDHLDQTYEIELQISDVEVLGDAAESMSYIVVDNEFDNNFLVGQLYQFDIAWLESQNDAFDVLNYNTDGSILCQYNYSVYSMYTFDYEKMLRQYQGKQLFCMGVCRGTEEEKYIDITFIEVK